MRSIKVGLTGGIAAGKSSVATLWRDRGALVIDSDALAHRTLEPDTPTYAAIVREFGRGILNADATINRPALGEIVFGNADRRQALNAIVHPIVRKMWHEGLMLREAPVKVVMIPLLFEVGVEKEFDVVVVVGCSEVTQLARLKQKGLTETQARARIQSQLPTQTKMDRGQFVIWNDGSLRTLSEQATMIWDKVQEN